MQSGFKDTLARLSASASVGLASLSLTTMQAFAGENASEAASAAAAAPAANVVDPDPATVFNNLTGEGNSQVKDAADKFLGIFRSGYTFVVTIGIILIAIGILVAVIRMILAGGGQEREKSKNDMLRIVIATIGLGGVLTIIGLMLEIGSSL